MNKTKPNTPFIEEIVGKFRKEFGTSIGIDYCWKGGDHEPAVDAEEIEAFLIKSLEEAEERTLEKVRLRAKEMVQKANLEVLALPDHDERRVAGRHYRTVLGKEIALIEFSKMLDALQQSTEKGEK